MDSQSHLTDAYVQVKHCDQNKKTNVVKRSLNPRFDAELAFDIADYAELQEEPLEMKVYDQDTWTADDLIGTVYLDLNVLLEYDR
ncbi:GTPase activating protein 1 [Diplonema papillatum]|nr:GTPase activating protein 1 [Diplonema papillatum]